MSFERMIDNDNFCVDYDTHSMEYRVSYFRHNHYVEEIIFDDPFADRDYVKLVWKTDDIYECSLCGKRFRCDEEMNIPQYKYCPYCGGIVS